MAQSYDESLLSRVELVVLARLSKPKNSNVLNEDQLGREVAELCVADANADRARLDMTAIVKELRRRGLVHTKNLVRTDSGAKLLRKSLGLTRAPTWDRMPTLLAALALGVPAGSSAAKTAVNEDALVVTVLCKRLGVAKAATTTALCDALIADALGMTSGEVTLGRIRAHFLARRAAVSGADVSADPALLASSLVRSEIGARANEPIVKALGRRWVCQAAPKGSASPELRAPPPVLPVPKGAGATEVRVGASGHGVAVTSTGPTARPPVTDKLLDVVRETIPRVGADGRYGSEKVFVSAIWRSIEQERRLADMSLDHFKRWLVGANRDGWLVLARADLVGAMDRKLVSESEIEDRGATFHFVLDQRNGAPVSRQGSHAQ